MEKLKRTESSCRQEALISLFQPAKWEEQKEKCEDDRREKELDKKRHGNKLTKRMNDRKDKRQFQRKNVHKKQE